MKIKIVILSLIILGIVGFILVNNDKKETLLDNNVIHKTKFGIYNGDTSLLALIAEEKGFFKEENIDVELIKYPSGYHAMKGMLEGEVDYANCAEYVASKYSFTHPNFKILGSMSVANINGAIANVSKGITTPQDMKNTRIGTTIGTAAEYYSGVFLEYNKLSLDDVKIVDIHPKERLNVFRDDKADVLFTWEPMLYKLKKEYKEKVNIFPMPIGFEFYFLIVSDEKFHIKNPIISSKLLNSLYKAQNYIKDHPEEFKVFVKNYFNFDEEYTNYILEKNKFELTFPYVLSSVLQNQFKWLKNNNLVNGEPVKLNTLFDTEVLKKIDSPAVTVLE